MFLQNRTCLRQVNLEKAEAQPAAALFYGSSTQHSLLLIKLRSARGRAKENGRDQASGASLMMLLLAASATYAFRALSTAMPDK